MFVHMACACKGVFLDMGVHVSVLHACVSIDMPLSIAYTWKENEVSITLFLTGTSINHLDKFYSPNFLRFNEGGKRLLTLDLFDNVEYTDPRETHHNGVFQVCFRKCMHRFWNQIHMTNPSRDRREKSMQEGQTWCMQQIEQQAIQENATRLKNNQRMFEIHEEKVKAKEEKMKQAKIDAINACTVTSTNIIHNTCNLPVRGQNVSIELTMTPKPNGNLPARVSVD